MSARRPSYSSSSSSGSFSAAQWGNPSYGSSYPSSNAYATTYGTSAHPPSNPVMHGPPGSMYADLGMQNSNDGSGVPLSSEYSYAATPRSAMGGSPSSRGPAVDPYGSGYGSVSQPIAISRPSASSYPTHHDHAHYPYISTSPSMSQSAYAPGTSPQSPSSPQSPVSPLSQYAYPASPQRPFACDMCALSFSRQHDLKRHRDTHSGEKPFFCNGGCGKQFTRKDALKRHQLVKRCGTEDN